MDLIMDNALMWRNWDRALYIEGNKISYYTYPNSQIIHNIVANIIDNTWHHCVITLIILDQKFI